MTAWQFLLYGFVFLALGGAMTVLAFVLAALIIGRSGAETYFGTVATIEHFEGSRLLFLYSAGYSYLVLLSMLLALQIGDPLDLFDGYLPWLWIGLTIIAAGLSVITLAVHVVSRSKQTTAH